MTAYEPVLNNVIASAMLKNEEELNLQYIASKIEGSRFNKKKFPGVIVRKTKPKGTVLIFKSNKLILVGTSSLIDCQILAHKITKDLKRIINLNISLQSFKITNFCANAHLGFLVNMSSLAAEKFAYKDDKFPGTFIKTPQFKSALVFASGKVVISGLTDQKNLYFGYQKLKEALLKHQRSQSHSQDEEESEERKQS